MYVKLHKTHAPGYSQPIKRRREVIFFGILLIVFYVILITFCHLRASKQYVCFYYLTVNLCTIQNL